MSNATIYATLLRSEWHSVENKRVTPEFRLTEFGVVLHSHAERVSIFSIEIW